jgi:hypothetical protein
MRIAQGLADSARRLGSDPYDWYGSLFPMRVNNGSQYKYPRKTAGRIAALRVAYVRMRARPEQDVVELRKEFY